MSEYERYAVYYAPGEDTALGDFGHSWFGFNSETGQKTVRQAFKGMSQNDFCKATLIPARYGFHGTLKPPFELKDDISLTDLEFAIGKLADELTPMVMGPLVLQNIGNFLALLPTGNLQSLNRLASTCVQALDFARKPETGAQTLKRLQKGLSARQESYLKSWGYPYVMEEFRFHLTLTGPLSLDEREKFKDAFARKYSGLLENPFEVRQICLFGDPGKGEPFRLLKRYHF